MIDRIIGIIGIALALLTAVLSHYLPTLPSWLAATGYSLGVLLIGLSIGLLLAGGLRKRVKPAQSASLRLHIFGDHRTPERISDKGIWRWFYYQTAVKAHGPSGPQVVATFSTLFLSFEPEVIVSTLRVRSPDAPLPVYDVREFNQRYAIIVFMDNVPAGTLDIDIG